MKSKTLIALFTFVALIYISPLFASTITASHTTLTPPPSLQPGWNSIQTQELKQDVTYLASDKLAGRLSLTKESNETIKWLVEQFKKAGLKPLTQQEYSLTQQLNPQIKKSDSQTQRSYLQTVPLINFYPNTNKNYLELTRGQKKWTWKKPDTSIIFPNNFKLHGDVVFAGYGITANDLHYDDYANINVRGKIVLIFEHEPQETNPHSIFNGIANTVYATPFMKAFNAEQHGAIAVLILPEPNRRHPSNQDRFNRMAKALNPNLPSQALVDSKIKIPVVTITNAVADQIAGNKISLSQLQAKIDQTLKPQSRLIPQDKITINNENKSSFTANSYNVVGLLEGSDPTLKHETVIISAHHDHDGKDGKRIWHGADDNASGTTGVIALARAMIINAHAANGMKPKRSILFVLFTAEERGLLGSFYMADHPLRPIDSTVAMINFDMIGRNESASSQTKGLINTNLNTTNRLNLIGAHYSPDYNNVVRQENQYVGLDLDYRFDQDAALNIFFRSDQFPFVLKHVPSFWWFTGFHPDYHHITDTADKINYVKMAKIIRLSYLTAFAFANDKAAPQFIENP